MRKERMLSARRTVWTVLVAGLAAAVSLAWLQAQPADASHGIDVDRLAGDDRIATAAEVAHAAYPEGADTALIAQAGDFPDALAAAPLARQRRAPVLLTDGDALSPRTRQTLDELGTSRALIVGGPAAVSEDVADQLERKVPTVDRVAGENRYETAALVARRLAAAEGSGIGELQRRRTAFVANGARFADALAASSPAASQDDPLPILLTHRDHLPEATRQAIADLDIQRAFVLGGSEAVEPRVEEQLGDEPHFVTVTRLAGEDRTETATAVAYRARSWGPDPGFDYDGREVLLARGDDFADALVAGPLGGLTEAPILLTHDPETLGDHTAAWLADECPAIKSIRAVGGPAAVADDTLAAASDCHEGRLSHDYVVAPQEPVTLDPGESYQMDGPSQHNARFLGSVDLALFPCDNLDKVRIQGRSASRFADADGDGRADGLGTTDTGNALIVGIEGHETRARVLRDVGPEGTGGMRFRLASEAVDCAIPVVFDDADDDGHLDVDADGLPLEFYGLGQVEWR